MNKIIYKTYNLLIKIWITIFWSHMMCWRTAVLCVPNQCQFATYCLVHKLSMLRKSSRTPLSVCTLHAILRIKVVSGVPTICPFFTCVIHWWEQYYLTLRYVVTWKGRSRFTCSFHRAKAPSSGQRMLDACWTSVSPPATRQNTAQRRFSPYVPFLDNVFSRIMVTALDIRLRGRAKSGDDDRRLHSAEQHNESLGRNTQQCEMVAEP